MSEKENVIITSQILNDRHLRPVIQCFNWLKRKKII